MLTAAVREQQGVYLYLCIFLPSTQPEEGHAAPSPAHECVLLVVGLLYAYTLRPEVEFWKPPI